MCALTGRVNAEFKRQNESRLGIIPELMSSASERTFRAQLDPIDGREESSYAIYSDGQTKQRNLIPTHYVNILYWPVNK